MTQEQINDLAWEVVLEIRSDAFDGDRYIGNQEAWTAAVAVLSEKLKGAE